MRIHSSILSASDFGRALKTAGLDTEGVYIDGITTHGSRKRSRAFELSLRAQDGRDRNGKGRRWPNGGSYGAETGYGKAATYDEWGWFIAALYGMDDQAIVGPYEDRDAFLRATGGAYPITFQSIS